LRFCGSPRIAVLGLADRLVDPLTPSITAVLVFTVTAGTAYSLTRRRERRAPSARTPSRAGGRPTHRRTTRPGQAQCERREVSALFTDIEVHRDDASRRPEDLVATLDQYFEALPAS